MLYLSENKISDLNPLKNLIKLSLLNLERNKICDLTPILDLKLGLLKIEHNYLAPVSEELRNILYEIRCFNPIDLGYQQILPEEISTEDGQGGGGSKKPRV